MKETAVPIFFPPHFQFMLYSVLPTVVGLVLVFLKKGRLGGAITYVKQLSDVQSKENSTDSPHVPSSSSASCLKSLLSSSHFRVKDSDLNRFSFVSETKKKHTKKIGKSKEGTTLQISTTSLCYLQYSLL